mgnify:FL=1
MPCTSKKVVLVGMINPYEGDDVGDIEIWCINRSFMQQPGVTRVYFFDNLHQFGDEFIDALNALPENVRVISRRPWPEVPRSEGFPLKATLGAFNTNIRYFQCTAAYMLAHSLAEKIPHVVLCGMYHLHDSLEYFQHKACMEFWLGVAMGMGHQVDIMGDTQLTKPFPWSPPFYAYEYQQFEGLANQVLAAAYRACLSFPMRFMTPEEADSPEMRDHFKRMAHTLVSSHAEHFAMSDEQKDAMMSKKVTEDRQCQPT